MSAPGSPPPGSMPSSPSPDMISQMMANMGDDQKQAGGASGSAGPMGQMGGMPGMPGGAGGKGKNPMGGSAAAAPRPIGNPLQEAKYMAGDIAKGLASFLPDFMQNIFKIKSDDTPQDAARKKQMLQRYQQMNGEQQHYVQEQMRAREHAKRQQEEEAKMRKQQLAAQGADDLPTPQGKTRGEGGPGASQKKNTMAKMQKDRQQLSSAG